MLYSVQNEDGGVYLIASLGDVTNSAEVIVDKLHLEPDILIRLGRHGIMNSPLRTAFGEEPPEERVIIDIKPPLPFEERATLELIHEIIVEVAESEE